MKVSWFYTLLAVVSLTGVLIAGFVARSEASSAMARVGVAQHDAGASTLSVPF